MKKKFIFLMIMVFVTLTNLSAQFNSDSIQFWIGSGTNSAILNVDFIIEGEPSSFAWGYHFDGTTTGAQILADIAEADEYFTVNGDDFLNDIFYGDLSGVAGNPTFWATWSKTEAEDNWIPNLGLSTTVENGHWFGCSYTFYDDEFNPINEPENPQAAINNNYIPGPFAPGADAEGSTAIPSDPNLFSAWATACVVERGSMDISDSNAEDASHGEENDAIGIADGLSVVSLGDGGNAILTFMNPIINGDGYDFAVFENGFGNQFLELAFVEVSSDGTNYFRFPSSSLTQTDEQIGGFGELDPTFINNLAGKYRANFGTPFELEELEGIAGLDVNAITHVKIIDVVGSLDPQFGTMDANGNFINDPFATAFASGGFDLDGVGVINSIVSIEENLFVPLTMYPNPASDYVSFNLDNNGELIVIDQCGRVCLKKVISSNNNKIDVSNFSKGIYTVNFISAKVFSNAILVVE